MSENEIFCCISGDVSNYQASGAEFKVSGWGALKAGANGPDVLHAVTVPFVSESDCKARYGEDRITEEMICAGDITNGGDDVRLRIISYKFICYNLA